jgi:energy-coupling factor transporter transmembrane protein EcfT
MSAFGLLDLPGAGRGPLRARSPQARLVTGTALLLTVLLAPAGAPAGALAMTAAAAAALVLAGTPVRLLLRVLLMFALLSLPLVSFLALARMLAGDGVGPWNALVQAGSIAARAAAILLVSAAVISTLPLGDIIQGAASLPVPATVVTILFHILQQSSLMLRETVSIAQAVALRRGAGGFRAGWVMARSIPSVWLPRVDARIERTARAAEVRGADRSVPAVRQAAWRPGDVPMIFGACTLLAATVILRISA